MFTFQTKLSMLRALVTKDAPFYIQFYISRACHLRCRMCNIVSATNDVTPFGADKIEAIADNLVSVGAGVVLLTGGEPTLRPDIAEIVRIFKQRKLDVRLQTAGLLSTWERLAQCVQYGARDINVSIDSLDERLSDYINGVPGSWRNAIKTIGFISRSFPGHDGICALGCVLSRYNVDEIEPVLDFATQIGWWMSLVPVHLRDPASSLRFRGCDPGFAFLKGDHSKVLELLARLKQKKKEGYLLYDSDDYLDSVGEFVTTGKPNWRKDGV